jgi:hypothetical protein
MSGYRAVAAAMALLIVTAGGCSSSVPGHAGLHPVSSAASARVNTCPAAAVVQRTQPAPWPSRIVLRESIVESISSQFLDPAAGAVYLLVSKTIPTVRGPWVLCRINLLSGATRLGPTFPVGSLTLASGYLWVYGASGPGSPPVVTEVNPLTMLRVRLIPLPTAPASFGGIPVAVIAGPASSLWIGSYRTLLRVSVTTGTTLATMTLPAGLAVGDISVDPAGTTLYVSAAHVVRGGVEGLVMLEHDARTGRTLATASGGLIRYSVAGATLTAVPGGVWASFRTGMLGLTIHLGAKGLQMIAPPGPGIALAPATGVFHWPMYETTTYGGGALWVANQVGIVACLDPRTGTIRASEHLPQSQLYQIEAIDPAARTIFALQDGDLLQITPPRRCWLGNAG